MFTDGLSEEGFFKRLSHDLAAWFSSRPEADPDHTLVDKHAQSVENRAPSHRRVLQELRPWRIGDEIAYDHAGLERFGVKRRARHHVRKEAD